MIHIIKDFPDQFAFEPEVINKEKLKKHQFYIVVGMGGSHLAADLIKVWDPKFPLFVHKNYGMPELPDEILKQSLFVMSSYSGNTEEVLDAYEKIKEKGYDACALSIGGKLIEQAKADGIPYVVMPDTGIQPRSALGFNIRSLFALLSLPELLENTGSLVSLLPMDKAEASGKELAAILKGSVPVIYSSEKNGPVAYNWKIKFNETAKVPAFCNIFPELNHNEMTGFDAIPATAELSQKFHFIVLKDGADHPKIGRRMEILKNIFEARKLPVTEIELQGDDVFYKIFSSLLMADWAAYYTSEAYGTESESIPMIEEFKKAI